MQALVGARLERRESVVLLGARLGDAAVRLGWHWRTAVRAEGRVVGAQKGASDAMTQLVGRASPAIAVSARGGAGLFARGVRSAPVSPAAQEAFQLATHALEHRFHLTVCPFHSLRCP